MVQIEKSDCTCGKCGEVFPVSWELEAVGSSERPMGEEVEYRGELEALCPNCGNVISGELIAVEYPVGCLELSQITDVRDLEGTNASAVKKPEIYFFDL